jgi:hypothetical protein
LPPPQCIAWREGGNEHKSKPSPISIYRTYLLLCLDDCLHEEDRGRRKLGQERSAVLDKEVVHLSLAPEPLLEVLDAYVQEC